MKLLTLSHGPAKVPVAARGLAFTGCCRRSAWWVELDVMKGGGDPDNFVEAFNTALAAHD